MKLVGTKTKLMSLVMSALLNLKEDKTYELEVKQCLVKRTPKANAYCWELMTKIAEVLNTSKEEVYEEMLASYGANLTDKNGEIITISTKQEVKSNEDLHIAFIGSSYLNDKKFYHYRLIKGSSRYNSKEMFIFIEGIKSECDNLGIETRPIEEIRNLCEALENMKER